MGVVVGGASVVVGVTPTTAVWASVVVGVTPTTAGVTRTTAGVTRTTAVRGSVQTPISKPIHIIKNIAPIKPIAHLLPYLCAPI